MKRRSVARFSGTTLEIPHIIKTLPRERVQTIRKKQPSEELVARLNAIGREYPFCVYHKQKMHDPL